jgi:poly(3-hydroxybutyrate) depolymerase
MRYRNAARLRWRVIVGCNTGRDAMTQIPIQLRRLVGGILLSSVVAMSARADGPALGRYNADPAESSVSGISSGAFMAVQFATAFSSTIKGVGVIAGGPFGCAQPSSWLPGLAIATALGPCMQGNPAPEVEPLIRQAEELAETHDIDSLANLRKQKIYVFHGYNDKVVARNVTDMTMAFYQHYLGHERGNIFYQTTYGAGHSQVTLAWGLPCPSNADYFIDKCNYDQAGVILQHIYGALQPRNTGPTVGKLLTFDQGRYTSLQPEIYSLADTGYVYVPHSCANGEACRVHIALHGCLQDAGDIGEKYVRNAGYNEWADNNHIIVLYPQTKRIEPEGQDPMAWNPLLVNPQACWDWWGYHDFTNAYMTHDGQQMAAIKAMLTALTAGHQPPAPTPRGEAVAPAGVQVTDVSDRAAALTWMAVLGADTYRVYRRAGKDGPFALVGSVAGPSFGDSGLTPSTDYVWRVSATVGGTESDYSQVVTRRTRTTPEPCTDPGTCAVEAAN